MFLAPVLLGLSLATDPMLIVVIVRRKKLYSDAKEFADKGDKSGMYLEEDMIGEASGGDKQKKG